jgi:hypothetical protein
MMNPSLHFDSNSSICNRIADFDLIYINITVLTFLGAGSDGS